MKNDMLALCNQTYLDDRIIEKQKRGFVLCIPKTDIPTTSADYKTISVVNTDYKFPALITANRIRPALSDMLHPSQYCGVPSNTICDAVTTVRNAIAYADLTHARLRTSSLDFTGAFVINSRTSVLLMLKLMAVELNLSVSYKRCMTRPSPRDKLLAKLQNSFAYNVPLHKVVQ